MSEQDRTPGSLWFLDTLVTIRVSGADGADGLSVIENEAREGDSPPMHVHESEDELFVVQEGELGLRVGEDDFRLAPGQARLAPAGVPHTYRVQSPAGARWLTITARGEFEAFVRELARPAEGPHLPASSGPPTPEQVTALAETAARHHIRIVGPPLEA